MYGRPLDNLDLKSFLKEEIVMATKKGGKKAAKKGWSKRPTTKGTKNAAKKR
jgi:hypothetical protein